MKVGDYVRTKYGEICKLKKSKYSYLLYETDIEIDRHNDRDCNDYGFDTDTIQDIIKSSPNIIDLIEVGDYVNGLYVYRKAPKDKRKRQLIWVDDSSYNDSAERPLSNDEIKSVLTKEMFEQMEYKVGEIE